MITPPNDYAARTHDYSPGDQVTSNDLNGIQDGLVALSDSVDALAAQKMEARTATGNQADSPAPDLAGCCTIWLEGLTNGTTVVVLDTFIDWRQRMVELVGNRSASSADIPGGASDDAITTDIPSDTLAIHKLFFTQNGQTGGWPNPGTTVDLGTETVRIFARDTDGALCMRKSAHAVDPDAYIVARVSASPAQNH